MKQSTRDWLILTICLAVVFSAVSAVNLFGAYFLEIRNRAEFLFVLIGGGVAFVYAICAAGYFISKWSVIEPQVTSASLTSVSTLRSWHPRSPPISKLAVASVILGFIPIGCCGLTSVAGFILGLVALHQIHASHRSLHGEALAIAGTTISFLVIAVWMLIVVPAFVLLS